MATEVLDWTRRNCSFRPINDGQRGSIVAWGASPRVGQILALKNGDKASCYRVTHYEMSTAADADVFTLKVEFIPGRDMPVDAELVPHPEYGWR